MMEDESLGHANVICRTLGLLKPEPSVARELITAFKKNPDVLEAALTDYTRAQRSGEGQEAKNKFCTAIKELTGITLTPAESQHSR